MYNKKRKTSTNAILQINTIYNVKGNWRFLCYFVNDETLFSTYKYSKFLYLFNGKKTNCTRFILN